MRAPALAVVVLVVATLLSGAVHPAVAAENGALGPSPWFPMIDGQQDPDQQYQLSTLAIVRIGGEDWRPNRGKYRSLLTRHDFYVTVGRTDLARHEAASAATSRLLFWSGMAGVVVGGLLFYAHVSPGGADPGVTPGLVVAGAGLASVYVSTFFTGPSVEPEEAEELAQRYNERLKRHFENELAPRPTLQTAVPRLVPWTDGRSAGGLMAVATF